MKLSIPGFVTYYKPSWLDNPIWGFQTYEPSTGGDQVKVMAHTLVVEVEDDWDPNPEKLAMLRKLRKEVDIEHAERVTVIDSQIANLLALPAPGR
jgi:hypothetical protein